MVTTILLGVILQVEETDAAANLNKLNYIPEKKQSQEV